MTTENKYHHGNLREILIEEGRKMLNRYGIDGFSMRALASSIGVSHTAAYRHFKDKNQLLQAIFEDSITQFYNALVQSVNSINEPIDKLTALGTGYVLFFVKNPEMISLFNLGNELGLVKNAPDSFSFFREIAATEINNPEYSGLSEIDILFGYWAKVHGLASLLVSQRIYLKEINDKEIIEMVNRIIKHRF